MSTITGHYEALKQHVSLHPISNEREYARAADAMQALRQMRALTERFDTNVAVFV